MNIGIDISRANRPQKTGVEWYTYHLIRNLFKIDNRNQYFLYTDKKLVDVLKPQQDNFQEKVLRWPLSRFWTLGRLSLEMIFSKPDILFIPSHTFSLVGGKKNVITWHDVGYEKYPETYTKWELSSLKEGVRRAIKMADKIITLSNFTKEEMVKHYDVNPDKIEVIYLGCNHNRWCNKPKLEVKQFLQKNSIELPYFIYLGRLALRKNIVGLIRMYNRFREKFDQPYSLILIGPKAPGQDEIDHEIRISPYKNEIKKMGWLPAEQLPLLLSGAQALVFPSIYEGFGLPTIEAMSCGCPVVASTAGSLPEVVSDAGLLVDTHDIDGFADKMIEVVTNQELRQDLIKKGFKRSKEFSWDKCARETLDVLESV